MPPSPAPPPPPAQPNPIHFRPAVGVFVELWVWHEFLITAAEGAATRGNKKVQES